jgi:protein SCO1
MILQLLVRYACIRLMTNHLLRACAIATLSIFHAFAATPADDGRGVTPAGLDQTAALRVSQSVVGKSIPDFTLLDREGRAVRLSQYRGKPLLVSFIYTGCFQVCPLTTRSLQTAIAAGRSAFGTNQFNVVSIGFNQPADSPQSLKAFALQYRIDQPNWEFLSPHASIVDPLTRAFGFTYQATPAGFDHVLQVTLLDAEGRIYRQIYGDELSADAIGEPIKQLLSNAPVAQAFRLDDLIDRVRILCTVYDPKTGTYEVKYNLLLEISGGVVFLLAVLWFFLAEWRTQRLARRKQASQAPSPASAANPASADIDIHRRADTQAL